MSIRASFAHSSTMGNVVRGTRCVRLVNEDTFNGDKRMMKTTQIAGLTTKAMQRLTISFTVLAALVGIVEAQISGEVRDGNVVVIASEPTELAGVDLISANQLLVPVPEDVGSAPFSFFLANTPGQITWGNLGSAVTLDGEWETGAGYLGDDPATDLTASWGSGAEPVAFPVNNVPEPSTVLLLVFGVMGFLGFRARRGPRIRSQVFKEAT